MKKNRRKHTIHSAAPGGLNSAAEVARWVLPRLLSLCRATVLVRDSHRRSRAGRTRRASAEAF